MPVSDYGGDSESKENWPLFNVNREFLSAVEVKQEIIDISSDSEAENVDAAQLDKKEKTPETAKDDPLGSGVVLTQKDPIEKHGMYDL